MKYGICEWSLPYLGPEAIRIASEIGFDGIQLGEAGGRSAGYPLNDPLIRSHYIEARERYGISFQALNLGALLGSGDMKFSPDTSRGELARESMNRGFDACVKLGIPKVVITFESDDDESFNNATEHVRYAEKLSKDTGVGVTIESALPLPDILELLERVSPDDGICMDLLNPLRFGTGDPKEQIKAFGRDRIDHLHFKDSTKDLFIKGQRGCVLLGTGDADLKGSCEILRNMGFDGWAISENYYYLPPLNDGSSFLEELLRSDLNTMKALL